LHNRNDHALFIGWWDYARAVAGLPLEAQAFQVWYFAMYPEKLQNSEDAKRAVELFGDLTKISRNEAKHRLRTVIAHFREDDEITNDARTERMPLILKNDR